MDKAATDGADASTIAAEKRSLMMGITRKSRSKAIAVSAALLAMAAMGGGANAGAVLPASGAATQNHAGSVEPVRYRGGGIGIYIGPSYGYGYDDYRPRRYGYYPRYRSSRYSYYDDSYSYRPYRRHGHRWVQERFTHPLGRR
jgi:hypothetical protein